MVRVSNADEQFEENLAKADEAEDRDTTELDTDDDEIVGEDEDA